MHVLSSRASLIDVCEQSTLFLNAPCLLNFSQMAGKLVTTSNNSQVLVVTHSMHSLHVLIRYR
jgi:hypothetical protein